jgi:hypothetical protein
MSLVYFKDFKSFIQVCCLKSQIRYLQTLAIYKKTSSTFTYSDNKVNETHMHIIYTQITK